jgi:hypothetical protein
MKSGIKRSFFHIAYLCANGFFTGNKVGIMGKKNKRKIVLLFCRDAVSLCYQVIFVVLLKKNHGNPLIKKIKVQTIGGCRVIMLSLLSG